MKIAPFTPYLLSILLAPVCFAGTVLFYDSNGGTDLERIASETDAAFIASSDANTSVGSDVAAIGPHGSQSLTVTLGTGNDLMFRFGSGAYSDDLPTALADGKWLGLSFVAAQDLNLDQLSFLLYNNSNNASSYSARHVGLYVRIGTTGGFTQFGAIDDSATGNGNQGTITFSDQLTVLSGQTVQIRLAFTDRTRSNQDAQAATRIGSIEISATAGGDATKVSASSTAPTANILSSLDNGTGGIDTSLFEESANSNHARGQLFALPNGIGDEYEISAITIKKSTTQSYSDDAIVLRIFEGSSSQWVSGTGHSTATDGEDYYVDTTVTPLHTEVFTLDGSFTDNDYVTFTLSKPITVNEDSDFGFFMTYHQRNGAEDRFRHRENSDGGRISISTTSHAVTSGATARNMVYYVQGSSPGVLSLASPFQDRMVLQRDKPVAVWGQTLPNTAVSVSIDSTVVNGTSDSSGDWELELPAMSAGGPYTLEVTSASETLTVEDVLVGDVWFCFGQSNMVWSLNSTGAAWHTAYENAIAAEDNIRCLKVDQAMSLQEQTSGGMSWLDNSTAGTWSAVASVFAYNLHQETGVPVGIIWAAWGSSSIEGWMPLSMADQFPHFEEMLLLYQSVSEYRSGDTTASNIPSGYTSNEDALIDLEAGVISGHDIFKRTRPNIIYNQMVHPLIKYGISGFIWYQGEANSGAPNYAQYRFTLPSFVEEYRSRFGQGDLPFLGVQLPSYDNGTDYWPWFRESQDQIRTLNNGHVAVTIDTGNAGNIHPSDKEPIGIRLSLLARKYALGESIIADSPRFDSMSINGSQVTLTFTNANGLTTDDGLDPAEFELAGADEVFYPATSSSISGSDVVISSTSVSTPVAVRYAWSPAPLNTVNLVNSAGLPAAPFRTDSFAPDGIDAEAPLGVDDDFETARDQNLSVPAEGILENDIDLNYQTLSASLISDVSNGSLTLNSDGSFDYTPVEGFAGADSFTYQASDGSLNSTTTTVNITVSGSPSAYYTWRQTVSWQAEDDATTIGDADKDGILNFLEFALGLDPMVPDLAGLPTMTILDESFVSYDFNNAQSGISYDVLLSTDLVNWSDPPYATLTDSSTTPVQIPRTEEADGKLFIRLRVSE